VGICWIIPKDLFLNFGLEGLALHGGLEIPQRPAPGGAVFRIVTGKADCCLYLGRRFVPKNEMATDYSLPTAFFIFSNPISTFSDTIFILSVCRGILSCRNPPRYCHRREPRTHSKDKQQQNRNYGNRSNRSIHASPRIFIRIPPNQHCVCSNYT